MFGKTTMYVTQLEVAPNSTPILVGRQASDPRPLAIDIPRRQACGCWASPCAGADDDRRSRTSSSATAASPRSTACL
jgi:hypothetical protein